MKRLAFAFLLLCAASLSAQEPRIKGTTKVPRDRLITLKTEGVAKGASVAWRITPVKDTASAPDQPNGQLVFNGPPGVYQVDAIVIDWDARKYFEVQETVIIGDAKALPPVDPPKEPDPKDPPVTPTGKMYFLLVRPDGNAHPDFTKVVQMPEWKDLERAGHTFNDLTATEASRYVKLRPGTTYPVVVTYRDVTPDGKGGKVEKDADGFHKSKPLPTSGAGILDLVK